MDKQLFFTSLLLAACTCHLLAEKPTPDNQPPSQPPAPVRLIIDPTGPVKSFGPAFAGLMTEEINHSYDGGLYAELIRNRVFRDNETNAEAWSLNVPEGDEATMQLTDRFPLTDKLPKSLEVKINKVTANKPVSISNEGYWGIPVKPSTSYKVLFYAKGNNVWEKAKGASDPVTFRSPLTVSLQTVNGTNVLASEVTQPLTGEWQKIELSLKTSAEITPSKDNKFVISATAPGTFRLSLVSLFPPTYKNRPNGNRTDLMEKLADLHPKFLRFPGGNYVEGDNLPDRYDWKETHAAIEFRPGHACCWNYRSSDGLGLLEFMGWCEDLEMQPVLAVYAGFSLKQQPVPAGPLLTPYVQDALDEIEYLSGDSNTTHWGAIRAKDGHPEPFKLKYIEIGNEDNFDRSKSYDARFAQFYDAIKAKYPNLQLIATMPVSSRKPDVLDDHYYKPAEWFVQEFNHYDKTDRSGPKIFVGEWATRVKTSEATPSLKEALGDAAWMCAMERNADLIVMQCYAPLLVNVSPGAFQWKPDLIGYDALRSYVSPSWHAQALFNTHRGDEVISTSIDTGDAANPLPYSVTRDKKKGLFHIKLVNINTAPRKVAIDLGKGTRVESKAEVVTLSSKNPGEVNSIDKPDAVKPVASTIKNASSDFSITLEPSSLTIISLKVKNAD